MFFCFFMILARNIKYIHAKYMTKEEDICGTHWLKNLLRTVSLLHTMGILVLLSLLLLAWLLLVTDECSVKRETAATAGVTCGRDDQRES
jgi:hypothetical protein